MSLIQSEHHAGDLGSKDRGTAAGLIYPAAATGASYFWMPTGPAAATSAQGAAAATSAQRATAVTAFLLLITVALQHVVNLYMYI